MIKAGGRAHCIPNISEANFFFSSLDPCKSNVLTENYEDQVQHAQALKTHQRVETKLWKQIPQHRHPWPSTDDVLRVFFLLLCCRGHHISSSFKIQKIKWISAISQSYHNIMPAWHTEQNCIMIIHGFYLYFIPPFLFPVSSTKGSISINLFLILVSLCFPLYFLSLSLLQMELDLLYSFHPCFRNK